MHDILQALDFATAPQQMNLPGLDFHALKGDLKRFYSVKVNANWRIIFAFEDKDAILVDYIDYHLGIIMIHKPTYPGIMVKNLCLEPLNLSVSQASKLLKVLRPTLSKLVNGHLNISPEMAMRLSIIFNTSEELWINLQAGYDLWKAQKVRHKLHLHPFVLLTAATA